MIVLSSRVWRGSQATVFIVVCAFMLFGCTSDKEPTATQAGQILKFHILKLLKERTAADVKITDAGGVNKPCGDGKAKQTFAATGRDSGGSDDPEALNALLVGALGRVAEYQIISADIPGAPIRAVSRSANTVLTFNSPGRAIYSVAGETECLKST